MGKTIDFNMNIMCGLRLTISDGRSTVSSITTYATIMEKSYITTRYQKKMRTDGRGGSYMTSCTRLVNIAGSANRAIRDNDQD